MRVGRRVLGIDVEVGGLERFDHTTSYVFMPDNLSFLDGPTMFMVIPQSFRVIIKKSIFWVVRALNEDDASAMGRPFFCHEKGMRILTTVMYLIE